MDERMRNEQLLDALISVAVVDVLRTEIDSLPSCNELNELYKPSSKMKARIDKIIRTSNRKQKCRKIIKTTGRVVASIAILITVVATTLLSVNATRNAIFNAFLDWQDKSTTVGFDDTEKSDQDLFHPSYLPTGYNMTATEKFGSTYTIIYTNQVGDEILFDQYPTKSGDISVDNEKTKYIKTKINGSIAYLFQAVSDEQKSVLIWESDGIVFQVTSRLESAELLRIAKSIKK